MTHEYTLLVGGTVVPGGGGPDATAIAWAGDTILALGTDEEVRAISRGDSHLVDLQRAFVVPLGSLVLEVGGRADLAVLGRDPRPGPADGPGAPSAGTLALIRGGRVVAGALPGSGDPGHRADLASGAGPSGVDDREPPQGSG